jgi:hypothetical protein
MKVSEIRMSPAVDNCRLEARVWPRITDTAPFQLWYQFPLNCYECYDVTPCDAIVAALLTPAMAVGEPLRIQGAISRKMMKAIPRLQAIYKEWNEGFSIIPVEADVVDHPPATPGRARRVGLFFSLGIDSFYSLLKNCREHPDDAETITDLLFVRGFDIPIDNPLLDDMFAVAVANAQRVADELGKSLVVVATNVRRLTARFADWGTTCHGAALASVALALGQTFRKVYIASTYDWAHLIPWGSHPHLDPLWSNGEVTLEHDGCEATRLDKTRLVAMNPTALQTLRVCFENPDALYNCGKCQKCLVTMIALQACGALDRCTTMPHDPRIVELLRSELGNRLLRAIPK